MKCGMCKGEDICVMKVSEYKKKWTLIIQLPQFQKFELKRKNAKHSVFKEERNIKNQKF